MILSEFNQPANQKIAKMNKILREQFGVSVKTDYPSKTKLEKVLETANMAVVKLRTSNKKFQLEADYAKFLGIKDIVETMLSEGMYAESPSYRAMKQEMTEKVRDLMDKGYSDEEACAESMNQYRLDPRFAFDDDHVKGLVMMAAKEFLEQCSMGENALEETDEVQHMDAGLSLSNPTEIENEILQLHQEGADSIQISCLMGLRLSEIENYLTAMGLPFESAFESSLEEEGHPWPAYRDDFDREDSLLDIDGLEDQYQYFPGSMLIRTVSGQVASEVYQEDDGSWSYYDHFSDQGSTFPTKQEAYNHAVATASKFSEEEIATEFVEGQVSLGHLLQEEVDVEQAEVVMAVRALADDIQDQVERLGRMINEEVPAIADQIRGEMGANEAQSFYDQMSQIINAQLETTRNTKTQMDAVVGQLSGEAPAAPDMTAPDLGSNSVAAMPAEPEADADAVDMNEPVAAGPEEEPLGRAAV